MTDAQREYAAALDAYNAALARLQEAKKHVPPSPRDLRRMERRAEAERLAKIPPSPELLHMQREGRRLILEVAQHRLQSEIRQSLAAVVGDSIVIRKTGA